MNSFVCKDEIAYFSADLNNDLKYHFFYLLILKCMACVYIFYDMYNFAKH